jgi:hypothetical protein
MRQGLGGSSCRCHHRRRFVRLGCDCCGMRFERRRFGVCERSRRLKNARDMGSFNVAQLDACFGLHLLKLPDVIGSNAGKSFLFIRSGVGRRFRVPLRIVSTKRAAINFTQASSLPARLRLQHSLRKCRTRRSCDRCQWYLEDHSRLRCKWREWPTSCQRLLPPRN